MDPSQYVNELMISYGRKIELYNKQALTEVGQGSLLISMCYQVCLADLKNLKIMLENQSKGT